MSFDWTKVDGYREDMTPDEKLALLDSLETETESAPEDKQPEEPAQPEKPKGAMVSKANFDKVSSELASLKKQLRSRMTEDEQKELERQNEQEELKQELENLRREKTLGNYKANYLALGYDEKMADEAATAMADGDADLVFELHRRHLTAMEKSLRAKILKETPVPPAGDEPENANKKRDLNDLRQSFGLPPLR